MLVELLDRITELSHEFSAAAYVRGGGGNTSVKTDTTLWVKPSGTTLATIKSSDFVAIDRVKLGDLYAIKPPTEASAREALVKEVMERAVLPETPGRASVEAPLHDSLAAGYVVHTHPALVNGMTCGKNGRAACQALFGKALWLDYIDPGYTLCMEVRKHIRRYKAAKGCEPSLIFLKNHGVFVAADTPEAIRALYADVVGTLEKHYNKVGVSCELTIESLPDAATVEAAKEAIRQAFADPKLCLAVSGAAALATGPVTPDHIVYAKSYYMTQKPTAEAVRGFEQKHRYLPHIIAFDNMVFGVGATLKKAELALELALDAALVKQMAEAFGGLDYMTDRAREFIENWEVESYRSKQVS
jgi:rhamnose utilization protein RhaD (predicted bifunctional aldolase and dehydrogenase)